MSILPRLVAFIFGLTALAAFGVAPAAPPAAPPAAQLPTDASSLEGLSATLRRVIIDTMPKTLYEGHDNWGHTRNFTVVEWKGHGLRTHPEVVRKAKNDSTWKKIRLVPRYLGDLEFRLSDLRQGPEMMTFKAFLAFAAGVEYDHQVWQAGLRLYGGSMQARLRLRLAMDCENLIRLDTSKSLIPDMVFRLRATRADVGYDHLVVEHIGGIGGDAARLWGEAFRATLKHFRPDLEHDLLRRANDAIVRAADTKEVRLSFEKLWKK